MSSARTITVIIDEFTSLRVPETVAKSLGKDHPLVVEATKNNEAKALIDTLTGKIARELRFVSIHLVIATQQMSVATMGSSELRKNLSSVTAGSKPGKTPSITDFGFLFEGDAAEAVEEYARFDDGHSKGLFVVAGEGGEPTAVRVAYTPKDEIPALLQARGVQRVPDELKFDLTPAEDSAADDGDDIPDELFG